MKTNIIITSLLLYSMLGFGQEQEDLYVLETDSTWTKELFTFPISFAQGIDYKGIEDARFPEGWNAIESPDFWSYVFAWHINLNTEPTTATLEANLQTYFDGLMGIDIKRKQNKELQNTMALFIKNENVNGISEYLGKVKTWDAFFTKKSMSLNVTVNIHYYEQQEKAIILFRFSPKPFDHDVWLKLRAVKINEAICED